MCVCLPYEWRNHVAFTMYPGENSLNSFVLKLVQNPANCIQHIFWGDVFALLDLHNSFSKSVTKTMQTARANKWLYQWGTIYSEFPPPETTFSHLHSSFNNYWAVLNIDSWNLIGLFSSSISQVLKVLFPCSPVCYWKQISRKYPGERAAEVKTSHHCHL